MAQAIAAVCFIVGGFVIGVAVIEGAAHPHQQKCVERPWLDTSGGC
jgi:hypothetical protein